ncbi:hemerythrin domain-containing protein [Nocardioides jishulii]|nr:hemerythrin domain-containing protein [Nocardioides jishulii]
MRQVHDRLRQALEVTRDAVADAVADGAHSGGSVTVATRDLLLFCRGFCAALSGHHEGEDRTLFPAIMAQHPELVETVRHLEQDHSMINHLLSGLQTAVDRAEGPAALHQHLEGLAAIMESHFRYEERQLLTVLETLELEAEVSEAYGPL